MNLKNNRALVDTFYVLDLDRCLVDTDKLYRVLARTVEAFAELQGKKVELALDTKNWAGSDFDMLAYVALELSVPIEDVRQRIIPEFIQQAQIQDVTEPQATQFTAMLSERDLPFGILTYGQKEWQVAKLYASRLNSVPYLVTDTPKKAHIIASWKSADGFTIPQTLAGKELVAQKVVLLDDKTVAFDDMPEGAMGIRVQPVYGQPLPMQEGTLPPNTKSCRGFTEVMTLLFE